MNKLAQKLAEILARQGIFSVELHVIQAALEQAFDELGLSESDPGAAPLVVEDFTYPKGDRLHHCQITLIRVAHGKHEGKTMVIYSQLDHQLDRPGNLTVTNGAENIATELLASGEYPVHPGNVLFVEHYPWRSRTYNENERFDFTQFLIVNDGHGLAASDPSWQSCTRADIEEMIGRPLAPLHRIFAIPENELS